ncbi:MAG: accessory factor UbiK family protein [Pseudomonadota bacterium]
MPNQKLLDEIGGKISQAINNSPAKDIEKNVRTMMQSALQKLDLVTREEFDVQQEVLLRTREKLIELESRVAQLEAQAPVADPVQQLEP